MPPTQPRSSARDRTWWAAAAVLGLVSYVPLLARQAGRVLPDGTGPVLRDPAARFRDALTIWDPTRSIGGLDDNAAQVWPLAPFHWLLDTAQVPDWAAQRLWTGSLLWAAAGGILFLGSTWRWRWHQSLAAGAVYASGLYALAAAADEVRSLLPFAALPWLLALTIRALRTRGWRHPALIALTVATVGPSDVDGLILSAIVPAAWVIHEVWVSDGVSRTRGLTTAMKIAGVTVAVNLWWIVASLARVSDGLALRHGPLLDEQAATATSAEVLRGLGARQLYDSPGADGAAGAHETLHAIEPHLHSPGLIAVSFLLPALAVLAAGITRWRHRTFVISLVTIGVVLASILNPADGGPPLNRIFHGLLDTRIGSGLDPTAGAPVIALGLATALGALVGALADDTPSGGPILAGALVLVAAIAFGPLWIDQTPANRLAPDPLPEHVVSAAVDIDRYLGDLAGDRLGTAWAPRAMVVPGLDPSVYDWGQTDQPVLSSLMDAPVVSRRVVPTGTEWSAHLVRDFDTALRTGTLAPSAVAPVARLLGIATIVVHHDVPEPQRSEAEHALDVLTAAPGLATPRRWGAGAPAPITAFDLIEPRSAVEVVPAGREVLVSGDASGIIQAAAAGVIDGTELVRFSAQITDDMDFARDALRGTPRLVVTDTNRKRATRWVAMVGANGYTETADAGLLRPDPLDQRLGELGEGIDTHSVADHGAVAVTATDYGTSRIFRTDLRPVLAADGDLATAWAVPATEAPGQRLELRGAAPSEADVIRISQRDDADVRIAEVDISVDGDAPRRIALDERSRSSVGQPIEVGGPFGQLTIEVVTVASALPTPPTDALVGIREITIAGWRAEEWIRIPTDLLGAAGYRSHLYDLDIVLTREAGTVPAAADTEPVLRRIVQLPQRRTGEISGTLSAPADSTIEAGCRDGIVFADGISVPVEVARASTVAGDRRLYRFQGCGGSFIIGGEEIRFSGGRGASTLEQLILHFEGTGGDPPAATKPAQPPTTTLAVLDASATDIEITIDRTGDDPTPSWVVFGQSFAPGWELVDPPEQIDGPHLVNGAVTAYRIDPDFAGALVLSYRPQNSLQVGLIVSAIAAAGALALTAWRGSRVSPPPIPRMEPLRRIRALTWEGGLPGRQDAATVTLITLGVALMVLTPLLAVLLAVLTWLSARREGWRFLFTVMPGLLIAVVGVSITITQLREHLPADADWPAATDSLRGLILLAVLALATDAGIEHLWRRNSLE